MRHYQWEKAFEDDGQIPGSQSKTGRRRTGREANPGSAYRNQGNSGGSNTMLHALRRVATGTGLVSSKTSGPKNDINRKGTIVLEHLLQAADVAHTMQVRERRVMANL